MDSKTTPATNPTAVAGTGSAAAAATTADLELWLVAGTDARSVVAAAKLTPAVAATASDVLHILNGEYYSVIESQLGRAVCVPLFGARTSAAAADSKGADSKDLTHTTPHAHRIASRFADFDVLIFAARDVTIAAVPPAIGDALTAAITAWNGDAASAGGAMRLLVFGVAALNQFVQFNYTGPFDARAPLPAPAGTTATTEQVAEMNRIAQNALKLSGEDLYIARHLYLLLIARAVLLHPRVSALPSHSIWALRYCLVHQSLLADNVPELSQSVERYLPLAERAFMPSHRVGSTAVSLSAAAAGDDSNSSAANINAANAAAAATAVKGYAYGSADWFRAVASARVAIESTRAHLTYWRYAPAAAALTRASHSSGLDAKLTGIMGKRTKFQVDEKAQLVASAIPALACPPPNSVESAAPAPAPAPAAAAASGDSKSSQPASGKLSDLKVAAAAAVAAKTAADSKSAAAGATADNTDPNARTSDWPVDVVLDHSVLLASWDLKTSAEEQSLSPVDQSILLLTSEYIRKTNPTNQITTVHEMLAYIYRALSPKNMCKSWSNQLYALEWRSSLEAQESMRRERAFIQLETLIAAVPTLYTSAAVALPSASELLARSTAAAAAATATTPPPIASATAPTAAAPSSASEYLLIATRMNDVYSSGLPPFSALKRTLADMYVKIDAHQSALSIYEELQLWDKVIEAYLRLGRQSKSEELIAERLKIEPESEHPKLYCLLGDVREDPQLYGKAWELSGKRYARAKRSLGRYYFARKEYKECIPHYSVALEINPLFPKEWFAMGYAGLEAEQYTVAAEAFSRVVSMDSQYGEAWNNLAAAHIKLKNKSSAFSALEQAVRFDYQNWKIWENYMLNAMDVAEFGKAMHAMERLAELKKNDIDTEILNMIAKVVISEAGKSANGESDWLTNRFSQLLTNLTRAAATTAAVWDIYARFHAAIGGSGGVAKTIESREKQCQKLMRGQWLTDSKLFAEAVTGLDSLVAAYLSQPTRDNLFAARSYLDTAIARAKKSDDVSDEPGVKTLEQLLVTVNSTTPVAAPTATAAAAATATAAAPPTAAGASAADEKQNATELRRTNRDSSYMDLYR